MFSALTGLALAAADAAAMPGEAQLGAAQTWSFVISMGVLVVVFYFFMIRPQKKKDKEAKALRDNLQIGDEITTIGGIIGIVVRKSDDSVVIETGGDRSKIRVKLWAISENATVHDAPEETPKAKKAIKSKDKDKDE